MFQGIPGYESLLNDLRQPTVSPIGTGLDALSSILGQVIKVKSGKLDIPGDDPKSQIMRHFLEVQGTPVAQTQVPLVTNPVVNGVLSAQPTPVSQYKSQSLKPP